VQLQTRQVTPGKIYLYPALVEVEDAPPANPFLLPARKASDLMWFDARASALQRTKLAGQVIYALPGKYFVMDGGTGFRVVANESPSLSAGDTVEAVGFPRLGGPSPTLQEAQIRKTGHAILPDPVKVDSERLLDHNLDSTLVQIEALLVSDTVHQDEQVLELQSGPQHFVARLKSDSHPRTSLPSGCRLRLTGVYASADEDQNQVGASLAPFELLLNSAAGIVVLQQPPWWTLRRAITAMSALAGVLAVTFIWIALLRRQVDERTAQLKKEVEERQLVEQHHAIEQERTRVARDLHDELGAGLTEVSMLGSLANTPAVPPETKDRYLDQITQTARSLVSSLDEIVWAVNPQYDSAASLAGYFSLFAQPFLNLAGIACRLRVAEDIPEYPLDSKERHGVFCAFKEALNNVVRHSGATEAQLIFEAVDGRLVLSVIDNGRGFELAGAAPGQDGLAGLRRRMQQLGGDCQITSQPGRGTKVEIHLPLKRIQHGQNRNR
jgi:signal transduction histidine kinase